MDGERGGEGRERRRERERFVDPLKREKEGGRREEEREGGEKRGRETTSRERGEEGGKEGRGRREEERRQRDESRTFHAIRKKGLPFSVVSLSLFPSMDFGIFVFSEIVEDTQCFEIDTKKGELVSATSDISPDDRKSRSLHHLGRHAPKSIQIEFASHSVHKISFNITPFAGLRHN